MKLVTVALIALSLTGCATAQVVVNAASLIQGAEILGGYEGPSNLEPLQRASNAPQTVPHAPRYVSYKSRR